MKKQNIAPSVFISYSWTSGKHEEWVINLAKKLRKDGVDAFIDKWHLKPGNDRFAFMEKMIDSKDIHKVLVICDKGYKEKADQRTGGVGVESQVISKNVYTKTNQEKFIPVLAERGNKGELFIPTYMESLIYIDLSDQVVFDEGYKQLLYTIFETTEYEKPELGDIPEYILQKKPEFKGKEDISISVETKNIRHTENFDIVLISDDTNYKHSIRNIKMEAFLPNKYDLGSCSVSFVNKEISGCLFTLHGRNLVDTFFYGLYTDARDCKRNFVIGFDKHLEKYIIQFPHNRFLLNSEETEELCRIIDEFFLVYVKKIRKYRPAKSEKVSNIKDLHDVVQGIQSFYNINNSISLAVDVKKAYEALKLALFRSRLTDDVFSYISSKLFLNGLSKDNICLKITECQNTLIEGFRHNGEVDMILRSLVVLLRDCKSLLSIDEIREIAVLLKTFEDTKDIFDFSEHF